MVYAFATTATFRRASILTTYFLELMQTITGMRLEKAVKVRTAPGGEFLRLMTQWGRWARESLRYEHCGSAEWQWRSPQCWDEPEPRAPDLDLAEVMAVERAIAGQDPLQPKWRYPLIWHYVRRAKAAVAVREIYRRYRVMIRLHHHDELLWQAERAVHNRLRRGGVL